MYMDISDTPLGVTHMKLYTDNYTGRYKHEAPPPPLKAKN